MFDIKLFVRNLIRNKFYTLITVLGFSIALTFVIILGVYIRQELSVDQFHINKDRIFRLVGDEGSFWGPVLGETLKKDYPEIECYTRLGHLAGYLETPKREKVKLDALLVDSAFFRMFSFPLLEGEQAAVFREKNSIVLTRSYALKLFGNEDALGEEVKYGGELSFRVTGIIEDLPENTHLDKCDAFLRFDALADIWRYPELLQSNNNSSFGLYAMAYPGTNLPGKAPQVLEKLKERYWTYKCGKNKKFQFEPLPEIYWGKKTGLGTHGNSPDFLILLSAVAFIVLLLALINYNNLSIAQATTRAREVAMKKLMGVTDRELLLQFILETVVLCFVAFGLAFLLDWFLLPFFNQVLKAQISLGTQFSGQNLFWGVLLVLALGVCSGAVPAYIMTRYKPVEVMKGMFRKQVKGIYGKVLICFQYVVAIVLMICTLTIVRQTSYLRNYDLGFKAENVVWLESVIEGSEKEALRNEFLKIPGVVQVSYANGSPFDEGNNNIYIYEDKTVSFQVFEVDTAFFSLLDISVEPTGNEYGIWVNRAALKEAGMDSLGFLVLPENRNRMIRGITEDFHFQDLTHRVGPVMIEPMGKQDYSRSILVRMDSPDPVQTFRNLKEKYSEFVHHIPFESDFGDRMLQKQYEQYEKTARLIGYFSVIAFTLAMMGILAMATYFIRQRVKEIGLRRVSGARIENILQMLIVSFMKWIVVAFVIACPLAWYIMDYWLASFPFRTSQTPLIYIGVGLLTALMALLMIGWQSYKAATTNPVNALRNE